MNEPDWSFPRCWQQGMHVAIPERTSILSNLGRDLAVRAPYAKVVADESSHLMTQLLPEVPRWLSDPNAARSLAGFAYHDYGPPNRAALRELVSVERRYGKP